MKKINTLIFAGFMSLSLIMTSCGNKENKTPEKELPEYTIKFVDYDQELLSEIKVKEGAVPAYDKEEPYRDPTREYTYTFSGWTPEIAPASADTTYTATYQQEIKKYTIKFVNEDGTELQSESLPYGTTPEYKGENPTKTGDAQYSYVFEGWDKEIVPVKKNETYTATFNSNINNYLVTFDTHGGTEIQPQSVPYGGLAVKPSDPTKAATAESYYYFDGWDYNFATPITGNVTINAQWYETKAENAHSESDIFIHYQLKAPTIDADGYKEFWMCPVHNTFTLTQPQSTHIVQSTTSYTGEILSTDSRYLTYYNEVIFDTNGGTAIDSQTVAYGECAIRPADPTKPAPAGKYYVFLFWDHDFTEPITEPITITASWHEASSEEPHGSNCVYVHYPFREPTATSCGYKEFWMCPVHDVDPLYEEPDAEFIVDSPSAYTGEILPTDPRYISYQYDEDHLPLSEYNYGAGMYLTQEDEYKNNRVEYSNNSFDCNLYSDDANKLLWRIELPRIDYTKYLTVTMDVTAPNWYEGNMMGPETDQLTYHTEFGNNKDNGKINLFYTPVGLRMEFIEMEHGSFVAFTNTFTNNDIIHGLAPAYFYTEDLYDRYLNIRNIVLSTNSTKTDVYSYGGDTTKITAVNGEVLLPGSIDFGIINNGYGTNETSLVVKGTANPGAAVITLPAFNFNQYTTSGNVSFRFGLYNNNEAMYFGSGESRISLGKNNPASQSNNNNGYVNWEMIVTRNVAYVQNIFENRSIVVELSSNVRNGMEGIVFSGGDTSIYRNYLFCDFYWQTTPDFILTETIYSYGGDTTKISVVNGTVAAAGTTDWSIIGNGYAAADTGLEITGNANPGAAVITLPLVNFNQYTPLGTVSFKFGVKNNGEHMYFGSGESRVDLGTNAPNSESSNNNGYVNWQMIITSSGAYIHNVYEDHDYAISLTDNMKAGTSSIVLSGGDTSIYRVYLFCDIYLTHNS